MLKFTFLTRFARFVLANYRAFPINKRQVKCQGSKYQVLELPPDSDAVAVISEAVEEVEVDARARRRKGANH